MEDSSNEKVKHEKKKYYVYAFWSVCIYIHMCNLCIELFIYILLLKFAISAILP